MNRQYKRFVRHIARELVDAGINDRVKELALEFRKNEKESNRLVSRDKLKSDLTEEVARLSGGDLSSVHLIDEFLLLVEFEGDGLRKRVTHILSKVTELTGEDALFSNVHNLATRITLALTDQAPLRYATFLDKCVELGLMIKTAGGYRFVHRYLLEYFAQIVIKRYEASS